MASPLPPFLALVVAVLSLAAPTVQACTFAPPGPMLDASLYSGYAFTRHDASQSLETGMLRDGVRLDIARSQCEDFIVLDVIVTLSDPAIIQRNEADWGAYALAVVRHLGRVPDAPPTADLQVFLAGIRDIGPHGGTRAVCADGSTAEPDACTWESGGGFVFSVTRTGATVRVFARRYIGG